MSDNAKGTGYEKRVRAWREVHGWLVDRAPRAVKWIPRPDGRVTPISNKVDFFGAFDLVSIHPNRPTALDQVTTAPSAAAKRRKIEAVMNSRLPSIFYQVRLWSWSHLAEKGYGFVIDRLVAPNTWELAAEWVSSKDAPEKPAAC